MASHTTATVYGLADPITGELKYIGETRQPLTCRLAQHIIASQMHQRREGTRRYPWMDDPKLWAMDPKQAWIVGVLAQGATPEIFEIERVPYEERFAAERFWVQYYRFIGCDLLNKRRKPQTKRGRPRKQAQSEHPTT